MAKATKTGEKRTMKPGKSGNVLPYPTNTFTSKQQPTPEQKSEGWKKWRAERHFTQAIISMMTKGKNLDLYNKSLLRNAKKGNPKAIETLNKAMEEDVLKIASTDSAGNDIEKIIYVIDERYKNSSGNPGIST